MSTHNIGFYEDLTKIIFELSSNIIKYAPYFFFWAPSLTRKSGTFFFHGDLVVKNDTRREECMLCTGKLYRRFA